MFEVAVGTVPVLFVAVVVRGQERDATVSIAGTLLGVFWLGFAFSHAVLLRQLGDGKGILIDVAVGTFLGDTGAYFGGRLFGRRPLAPSISPKKTVEGLICGMIVAIVAVYFASLYQSSYLHSGVTFALGLSIAVLGPLGDLFESLVKREAGTKDAGNLFGAARRRAGPARRGDLHGRRRLLRLGRRGSRDPLSTNPPTIRAVRRLVILGSTGSIGVQALDVVARSAGELQVVGLSAQGTGRA